MKYILDYYKQVAAILDELSKQTEDYKKAGQMIADAVKNKKLIHIVGTEMHSSIAAEEIFFRAGSLANINPLYDPTFSVTHSAARSLYLKEADFCGQFLFEYYRNIQKGDLILIIDTDGIGKACKEVVEKSKEMELSVIVVTSRNFSEVVNDNCPYRNSEKINLCNMDGIDLVIDSKIPAFDTIIRFEELNINSGWVSTIANSFILNAIILAAIETIEKENIEADIWDNFYEANGLQKNEALIDKYIEKVKHI